MANNTIRITTTPNNGDKYIKVKLEQSFDFIEILSLKITQEDAYRTFCSDYGVIVGRVIINSGFGVPNAKVSVFIPIDELDSGNSQIKGLYPYELISDKDSDGIRYNLLPREAELSNPCFTPIGTFPSKRQVLDNTDMLEIYNKYYKFTTTTNHAGDFMIFGVPLGTHTVHVDADISDIGIASQRPYDSISQGAPISMFESTTKFKGGTNIDKLVQVKSANIGVNVQPFWGDKESCELGISRVDIDLNYIITPSAIFMGSIFGDQDKNSVNKTCRPRKDMGSLCEQVTGEGTIEMIRETIEGDIEQFDINGGRVIDSNGSWAYQVPMNLDYMITDETGNLVLSDDPTKGIPTRANIRFRIGMDQTGGEGRLRTRAKYLVPHNPAIGKKDEIDYEFGPKTKKTSLRSIYWNKIYSVSNFISRYQTTNFLGGKTNTTTGIKDVDNCVGNKNPFPYNRVSVESNPLFFIICLIIQIVGLIMAIINSVILPILNTIIQVLNGIFDALCWLHDFHIPGLGHPFRKMIPCPPHLNYIPCLYASCGEEGQEYRFAPGCAKGTDGYEAGDRPPDRVPTSKLSLDLVGLDDCIAFQIAAFLNIFEFDFYNDWINGSLYGFLLKYKKKGRREKFCDYECQSSPNDCHSNFLSDNNYLGAKSNDEADDWTEYVPLSEGLIKKFDNEFYYAASTHNAGQKIFATEIINLGAIFSCDWQGVAKLQPFLIETTYKMPPIINEFSGDGKTVITTGQCSLGKSEKGEALFFDISCKGLVSTKKHVLNIRHICEFGVELDEYREGNLADGIIGSIDIDADDGDRPKLFRDVFYNLNIDVNTWTNKLPRTTNFNTTLPHNKPEYNFVSATENGPDYVKFRGYTPPTNNDFAQPSHSYFFYFGINPGKTGLDKLNQNFFAVCRPSNIKVFTVDIKTIATTYGVNNNGSATFIFINGAKPITYTVTGPSNYRKTGTAGVNNADPIFTLNNLVTGEYNITATDSFGKTLSEPFVISPAPALYADAFVSKQCTSIAMPDGQITIIGVGGGNPSANSSYTYVLYNALGSKVAGPTLFNQIPTIIGGLSVSTQQNFTPISFKPIILGTSGSVAGVSSWGTNATGFGNISPITSTKPLVISPTVFTTPNITTRLSLNTNNTFSSTNLSSRLNLTTTATTKPIGTSNLFTPQYGSIGSTAIQPITNTSFIDFSRANALFKPISTTPVFDFTRPIGFNTVIPITKLVTPIIPTYVPMPDLTTHLKSGSYTLVISDSSKNYVAIENLVINGASQITLSSTKTDTLCFNDKSGTIDLKVIGGEAPYSFKTTTSKGFNSTSQKITGLSADTYTSTVTDKHNVTDTFTTIITSKYPEIKLVTGSSAELLKQCSPDYYIIKLYITTPYGAGKDVNLEFNIDNTVDSNGELIWEPYKVKFVDNKTPLDITIPVNFVSSIDDKITYKSITGIITFRAGDDTKNCYSNMVDITEDEMPLPQSPLTISSGDRITQTSPYQVKFNFNINFTPEDITARGPFTAKYTVTAYSHGNSQTSAVNTTTITKNKEIITATVSMVGTYVANDCKVNVYIIDKNGCSSPAINMNIDLPG